MKGKKEKTRVGMKMKWLKNKYKYRRRKFDQGDVGIETMGIVKWGKFSPFLILSVQLLSFPIFSKLLCTTK